MYMWWRAILDIDDFEIFNMEPVTLNTSEFISGTEYWLLSVRFFGLFETSYGLQNFLNAKADTVRQMLISS